MNYLEKPTEPVKLSTDIALNIETIKRMLGFANDLITREFTIAPAPDIRIKAAIILIKGLTSREIINEQVITALMEDDKSYNFRNNTDFFQILKEYSIPNTYVDEETDANNMLAQLIDGNAVLLLDKVDKALIIGSTG